jgi:hypothetical protein
MCSSSSIFVMYLPGTTTRPTKRCEKGICNEGLPAVSAASFSVSCDGGLYSCVKPRIMLHSLINLHQRSYSNVQVREFRFTYSVGAFHLAHKHAFIVRVNA